MDDIWTVQRTLDWTTGFFEKSGITEARLDAEVLLASVLQCPRLELHLKKDERVPEDALKRYKAMIAERARRKPISYILGEREFMGLRFKVNSHTLIPRPETEILVEETIKLLSGGEEIVVDVGAGSGNIPVSLAKASPKLRVYATDISIEALRVAQENVDRHGLSGRITLKQGDLLAALANEGLEGRVSVITSNPPYIAESEMKSLEPELSFEPALALVGSGEDGTGIYRRIAREAKDFIRKGGYLVFEMNANRRPEIEATVIGEGFTAISVKKDYSGLDRVLIAQL